ncbi:MAG: hypothetical protein ACQETH_06875 [Candidatus Rifleibacteriota bacterium]
MISILMAVFIFSFNSIVRQRNIQAHHLMISETAGYLALSGLRMLSDKLGNSYETTLKTACPQLFTETADDIGGDINLSSSNPVCTQARNDFQNFLNELDQLKAASVDDSYPVCNSMSIVLEDIQGLTPDTTNAQFQAGRDPVEKCGKLVIKCEVEYNGLTREAILSKQFRVVSMIPGAFNRFSLFVKRTPYPDSYNCMGIKFDGSIDSSYSHLPADHKTYTGPLTIFNGTDSANVTSSIPERTSTEDKEHLRNRGWIFIGPAGATGNESVFLKVPSGFDPLTGGHFMMGWPSVSAMPVLAPEIVTDSTNFAPDSDFADYNYNLGAKYQGFYTWETGNPFGAGGKNLWPGLTSGDTFQPSDHLMSASSWLYPFGNQSQESRTLIIGPVLAGFLKYYFIRGINTTSSAPFKGLWGELSETDFNTRVTNNESLQSFTSLWAGSLNPPIEGGNLFRNGFDSFKTIMPYNSLPDPSPPTPTNGIAFNLLFDFMKYQRSAYPNLNDAPSTAAVAYDAESFLVPQAQEMRSSTVPGMHPFNFTGIYFEENGQYDPNAFPDNCYFYGDLSALSVFDSNLFSNRITHTLDLKDCSSTAEESEVVEKYLFKDTGSVNETDKAGIVLIKRRSGVGNNFTDSLVISSKKVSLIKPQIVIIDKGSLTIKHDITANMDGGAPDCLFSIALINGNFFIDGSGYSRTVHGSLISLNDNAGRLLRPVSVSTSAPKHFEIHGTLALTEIGLYSSTMSDPLNHLGSTMLNFTDGGEIHYNPRFNPSSPSYKDSRIFTIEDTSGHFEIRGGS